MSHEQALEAFLELEEALLEFKRKVKELKIRNYYTVHAIYPIVQELLVDVETQIKEFERLR